MNLLILGEGIWCSDSVILCLGDSQIFREGTQLLYIHTFHDWIQQEFIKTMMSLVVSSGRHCSSNLKYFEMVSFS